MIETIKDLDKNLLTIFIPVIFLVLGIIGFFIKRWFTQRDTRIFRELEKAEAAEKEFSKARKEFISAFDDALKRLHSKGQHANGILSETMPDHKIAFETFRSIVEKFKGAEAVNGLDKVWDEYYGGDVPFAKFHTNVPGWKGIQDSKEFAINKIQAIIDFVKKLG